MADSRAHPDGHVEMSPTVLRYKKYRLFFFSREETRRHVHIVSPEGEAKFWQDEIIRAWNQHFTR